MFRNDSRIIVTLDAGGTNFVFGAMRGGEYITRPLSMPSRSHDLDECLETLTDGFRRIIGSLDARPSAISFAFPGPADYPHGIIGGNLPNFPSFRDGVALGPYLERTFALPVFINNDGNLFALGEAVAGGLHLVNSLLEASGNPKRYENLVGVTLGTGFGCGVVTGGRMLLGDNGCGGDVWCLANERIKGKIVEESVSIRAVKRVYRELSSDMRELTPKDICDIADRRSEGDAEAAKGSFEALGAAAGDALATVTTLIDGVIVLGGGLTGAARHFMPSLLASLRAEISATDGTRFPRVQSEIVYLDGTGASTAALTAPVSRPITIYGSDETARYDYIKRTPVLISSLGASRAVSVGAYVFALNNL